MARAKGSKNKTGHKGGGDRRSSQFKQAQAKKKEAEQQAKLERERKWKERIARSSERSPTLTPHPLSPESLKASQKLLSEVLEHPSMPKSRDLPSQIIHQSSSDSNEMTQPEENEERDDDDDDMEVETKNPYRQGYLPPAHTPLGLYLESVKKRVLGNDMLKRQKIILPTTSPTSTPLLSKPCADNFYKDVVVINFDPRAQYHSFDFDYCCPGCKGKDLKNLGKRYRPAFNNSKVEWILYDRFQCRNDICKGVRGRNRCFSTIDTKFVSLLPTAIAREFEYIMPTVGPGIHRDMIDMMSAFTDKHVLFGSFADVVNKLQWNRYWRQSISYYELLSSWLERWPSLKDYSGVTPFHAGNYNGAPFTPYSAFGCPGYHNGIQMTEMQAKSLFLAVEESCRLKYMQNSFQAWHDNGMTVDDTFKITKKVFVNTSGRSRVKPFTAMQTILSKLGKIVSSRFKFTKGQAEVISILEGVKESREITQAGNLDYLAGDNPDGDRRPFDLVFQGELQRGTTSFEASHNLPRLEIPNSEIKFFTCADAADTFILSIIDSINRGGKRYGLDTEFERFSRELTIVSVSFENLPIMVFSLFEMKKLPEQLKQLLNRHEFIACGRQVSQDCKLIQEQFGVKIINRIELGNMALLDKPELSRISKGTGVAHLTETYLLMRVPVEKSVGQEASYAVKNLPSQLILYAAADALLHRLLEVAISNSLEQKRNSRPSTRPAILTVGQQVTVLFRGRPVAQGSVAFHGNNGNQKLWGSKTVGKNSALVNIEKVMNPLHKPTLRLIDASDPERSWPENAKTLGQLWDEVNGLQLNVPLKNLTIIHQRTHLFFQNGSQTGGGDGENEVVEDNISQPVNNSNPSVEETSGERQYTRALRDIFHQFHNLPLPRNSVASSEMYNLIIIATWINNDTDYDAVVDCLLAKGIEDIQTHEYFNRQYWRERVRRGTPSPHIHAANLREIHGICLNDKRFKPHMSKPVNDWFESFISNAEKGLYQMPQDLSHYILTGTDSDGLNLYRSELGTNMNEILHQKYADLVGAFGVGVQVAHVLTVLRSFRFNISVGISRGGEPDFGTDRHELVDQTQHWMLQLFSVFAWPAHKNLLDFQGTDFVSVGVGPLPVDDALVDNGPPKEGLSSDYNHLCVKMGHVLAPLPPSTVKEYKIFTSHMRRISGDNKRPTKKDFWDIAMDFKAKADGRDVFPKTVDMLCRHYHKWKLNQQKRAFAAAVREKLKPIRKRLSDQRVEPPTVRKFSPHQAAKEILEREMVDKRLFAPPEAAPLQANFIKSIARMPDAMTTKTDSILDWTPKKLASMSQPCAWFPICQLQRGICGGTKKHKCKIFGSRTSDLFLPTKYSDVQISEISLKRKADIKKFNRKFKTQNEAMASQTPIMGIGLLLRESVLIPGPFDPQKGYVIVSPLDSMPLLEWGTLVNDVVVMAYLTMLIATQTPPTLRIVHSGFLSNLDSQGWDTMVRWLQETELAPGTWMTADLIFIPAFLGPSNGGHWTALIVDRRIQPGRTTVLFADSLSSAQQRHFQQVKWMFRNSPFSNSNWKLLQIPTQANASNDCSIFMLHTFAAWLRMRGEAKLDLKLECSMNSFDFGMAGRAHVFESIRNKKIDLTSPSIVSWSFSE